MNAVVRPPGRAEAEPDFLLARPSEGRRIARAGIASLLLHAIGVAVLFSLPHEALMGPRKTPSVQLVAPLIEPRELTQTAPNKGEVGHEFALDNLVPRPPVVAPPGPPFSRRTAERNRGTPEPKPRSLPEPPKVDTAAAVPAFHPPPLSQTNVPPPPPPQIQTDEKPKLAFETPAPATGVPRDNGLGARMIAPPSNSVSDAIRDAVRGTAVGDLDLPGMGGIGPGINLPPSPGSSKSALELMSDPMGVDFRPYLIRILAIVKRNWLMLMPESAREGRPGRVQIQFAIARDGRVPKLVIAMPSGTQALDLAAVRSISASTPFPPLPPGFKGDQVRLQFTFSYNIR